jgi:hypothetical protein
VVEERNIGLLFMSCNASITPRAARSIAGVLSTELDPQERPPLGQLAERLRGHALDLLVANQLVVHVFRCDRPVRRHGGHELQFRAQYRDQSGLAADQRPAMSKRVPSA